jgi:hypothetical protein
MNNLNEVLPRIMEKIKNNRSLYEKSEMAVRGQIIDPILSNLGWDSTNPDDILPMPTEEGTPDYSLIKDGKTMLFIKVKNMSVDVDQNKIIRQLANYIANSSFGEGKGYGVLTNGIVWILIRSFEDENKLYIKKVWKTNIENGELSKVIRKINTISKDNIEYIGVLPLRNILDEIWQSLLDKPEEIVMSLSLVVKPIISQKYSNYPFENSEIEDFLKEKITEIISGQFDKENGVPPEQIVGPVRNNVSKYLLPPNGTMCQFLYKSSQYNGINGTIENGQLRVDPFGTFSSFSGACRKITETPITPNGTSLNGWLYWKIKLPDDNQWQFANIWRDMAKK